MLQNNNKYYFLKILTFGFEEQMNAGYKGVEKDVWLFSTRYIEKEELITQGIFLPVGSLKLF